MSRIKLKKKNSLAKAFGNHSTENIIMPETLSFLAIKSISVTCHSLLTEPKPFIGINLLKDYHFLLYTHIYSLPSIAYNFLISQLPNSVLSAQLWLTKKNSMHAKSNVWMVFLLKMGKICPLLSSPWKLPAF